MFMDGCIFVLQSSHLRVVQTKIYHVICCNMYVIAQPHKQQSHRGISHTFFAPF